MFWFRLSLTLDINIRWIMLKSGLRGHLSLYLLNLSFFNILNTQKVEHIRNYLSAFGSRHVRHSRHVEGVVGWVNSILLWSLVALSKRIIYWWCWFSSSFIKFWYFCSNLHQPTLTSTAPWPSASSAPRTLSQSSAVVRSARSTASGVIVAVDSWLCSP